MTIKKCQGLIDDVDRLLEEQYNCKLMAEKIYEEFGKVFKIRRIYIKPKKDKSNSYYQITFEKDIKESQNGITKFN